MPAIDPCARESARSCPQGLMGKWTSLGCAECAGHIGLQPEYKKATRSLIAYDIDRNGWVWGMCRFCLRLELATEVLYQIKYLVKYLCNVQGAPLTLDVAFLIPDA